MPEQVRCGAPLPQSCAPALPQRVRNRGKHPEDVKLDGNREAHYKPYRVMYRIMGTDVVIYCVVDGRRDMRSFL